VQSIDPDREGAEALGPKRLALKVGVPRPRLLPEGHRTRVDRGVAHGGAVRTVEVGPKAGLVRGQTGTSREAGDSPRSRDVDALLELRTPNKGVPLSLAVLERVSKLGDAHRKSRFLLGNRRTTPRAPVVTVRAIPGTCEDREAVVPMTSCLIHDVGLHAAGSRVACPTT